MFLGSPPPVGFGWSEDAISGSYGTPLVRRFSIKLPGLLTQLLQVSVLIGEIVGRYTNDWIMNWNIRRNKGVFEAESRLWQVWRPLPGHLTEIRF